MAGLNQFICRGVDAEGEPHQPKIPHVSEPVELDDGRALRVMCGICKGCGQLLHSAGVYIGGDAIAVAPWLTNQQALELSWSNHMADRK